MQVEVLPVGFLQMNCYFVYNEEKRGFLVDPGDKGKKILNKIEEIGMKVEGILLTHTHFDHVGALQEIREKTKAPVYVHEDDVYRLIDGEGTFNNTDTTKWSEYVDIRLKGGETLEIAGMSIKSMHTKGHTKGCICYLVEEHMFSGDTLFYETVGRCDLEGGDLGEMMETVKKLKALPKDYTVYPGHGKFTTLSYEISHNPYFNQ